jgi:protein-tyrosine-phosphatase
MGGAAVSQITAAGVVLWVDGVVNMVFGGLPTKRKRSVMLQSRDSLTTPDSGSEPSMPAILFVCTANRIRSPLAEHLLRRRLANELLTATWRVESAGAWTDPDLPALPVARQAGAELGVDLSEHRSRRVEDLNLQHYDLILTMERGQRDMLRVEHPYVAERIMTMSEATTGYDYDIADPPGHTQSAVRSTARDLNDLINRGAARLVRAVSSGLSAGLG